MENGVRAAIRDKCKKIDSANLKYIKYMCIKGKCQFYKNDKCEKGRIPEICARKGLKNR